MRFVVSGEFRRNRLLQVIVVLFVVYVALFWATNALLYFRKMGLTPASVVEYYLGSEESFAAPRSYAGMLEVAHFHLFAMGILLMTLTHLMLFVPLPVGWRIALIVTPFAAALADEGGGWLVRFVSPSFAAVKIAGFLALEGSLAALIAASLWAVFAGSSAAYAGLDEEDEEGAADEGEIGNGF